MVFFQRSFWRRLRRDERGISGIEFGLVASLVAMTLVGTLQWLGDGVLAKFDHVHTQVAAAVN